MTLATSKWDVVDYLKSEESITAYLEAILADGDPQLIAAGLGDVARAKGMADIAAQTGLSRESLYKALSSDGNPRFATVLKVVSALGLQFRLEPRKKLQDAA